YQSMKAGVRTAAQTRALVASMTRTNGTAKDAMLEAKVRCATDVTGFGLAGHALNISKASQVDLVFDSRRLPALPGVVEHLMAGIYPGTADVNRKGYGRRFVVERGVPELSARLASDPQTSGGLLLAVSPRRVESLLASLDEAWVVGEVRVKRAERACVRLMKQLESLPDA
ncbi:MAG: AIR synthase-related protein, partial [Myxococcota bacterium]